MEERRRSDHTEWAKQMRRGWYLGDEEFRHELLAQMDGKMGHHHGGPERRESAEQRAESLLKEELKRRGWDRKELKRQLKADPGKVQVAGRLRKETTMNWEWIAASLMMGAADYAVACVRRALHFPQVLGFTRENQTKLAIRRAACKQWQSGGWPAVIVQWAKLWIGIVLAGRIREATRIVGADVIAALDHISGAIGRGTGQDGILNRDVGVRGPNGTAQPATLTLLSARVAFTRTIVALLAPIAPPKPGPGPKNGGKGTLYESGTALVATLAKKGCPLRLRNWPSERNC